MLTEASIRSRLTALKDRKCAVVYGGETHVAITQTCLDLIADGYCVFVAVDTTSSFNSYERNIALERLRNFGV